MQSAFALACGAAYLVASYFAAATDKPTLSGTLLAILPFAVASFALAWKSRVRYVALGLFVLCIVATIAFFGFLRDHATWLYLVQNAGVLAALGVTFGATLWGGDAQALCSRIALALNGRDSSPALLRYTWKVTLAWTIYFFVCTIVSVLLFAFAPVDVWSAFANLATPVLLGAMFLGEYWIRRRAVPEHAQIHMQAIIDAYRKHTKGPKGP